MGAKYDRLEWKRKRNVLLKKFIDAILIGNYVLLQRRRGRGGKRVATKDNAKKKRRS